MKIAALALAMLIASSCEDQPPSVAVADEGPPFVAVPDSYVDAHACIGILTAIVERSAPPAFDKAVGPYSISAFDVRAHRIKAQGRGHEIEEFRCLDARLQSRRWSRGIGDVKPFTMDDIEKMSFPQD